MRLKNWVWMLVDVAAPFSNFKCSYTNAYDASPLISDEVLMPAPDGKPPARPTVLPRPVERALYILGQDISAARRTRRFSQEDLAQRAGVSVSTIRRMEDGHPGTALQMLMEGASYFRLGPEQAEGIWKEVSQTMAGWRSTAKVLGGRDDARTQQRCNVRREQRFRIVETLYLVAAPHFQ